jgi:5-methylcytosine-specific restriction endonuclease McrA
MKKMFKFGKEIDASLTRLGKDLKKLPSGKITKKTKTLRHIPTSWKTKIIKRQRGYCAGKNCAKEHGGKKKKVDIYANFDHKVPLAINGKNIISNLQALCATCHQIKTRDDREKIQKWKSKQKMKKTETMSSL